MRVCGLVSIAVLATLTGPALAQSRPARTGTTARARPPAVEVKPVSLAGDRSVPGATLRSGQEEVLERLEARASYLRKGDLAAADVELGHLLELREALGPMNMPLASSTLIDRAETALRAGDVKQAMIDADAAVRLSPDLPSGHWMRARVAWSLEENRLSTTVDAVRRAALADATGFANQVALLFNAWLIALLAFALFALGAAAASLARYLRSIGSDLAVGLPAVLRDRAGMLAVLVLLSLPLALGLGPLTAVTLVLLVLVPYQSLRERIPTTLILLGIAALPTAIEAVSKLIVYPGSSVEALFSASTEAFAPEAEVRLAGMVRGDAPDYDAAFLLGSRARFRGELASAEQSYRAALKARPGDMAAENNLATVLYLQRNTEEALKLYTSAANAGQRAEPVLNVASLYLEAGRFDEARAQLKRASAIDQRLAENFNDVEGGTGQRLLDLPFDSSRLWARLDGTEPQVQAAIVADVWSRLAGPIPSVAFTGASLALLLLGWALAYQRPRAFSMPCTRCGAPADRTRAERCCPQCISIYLSGGAVDPGMRLAKDRSIARRRLVTTWTERVLVPLAGLGAWVRGSAIEGLILWLPFCVLVGGWIIVTQVHVASWGLPSPATAHGSALFLVSLVPLALFAAYRAVTRE